MTVSLGSDTFVRANAGSWGTASDGVNTWVKYTGTATASIVSNKGQMTGSASNTVMTLGTGTATDAEILFRFSSSAVAASLGPALRIIDANNMYRVILQSTVIKIAKFVAGVNTPLASSNSITYAASTNYWIRFRVAGPNLYVNFWADGSGEPAGWTVTITDTTFTTAGRYGIRGNGAANGDILLFDSLTVNQAYSLGEPLQATFKTRSPAATALRSTFTTRATLTTRLRDTFLVRAKMVDQLRTPFRVRSLLMTRARDTFVVRSALKNTLQSVWKIRTGIAGQGRSRFFIQQYLTTRIRNRFMVRSALTSRAQARFFIRSLLVQRVRGAFRVRSKAVLVAQSRFRIRSVLLAPLRATFKTKASFITPLVGIKALFSTAQFIKALFSVSKEQVIQATFTRSPQVVTPNSYIAVTATVTDFTGTSLPSLSTVAVVVTFPDQSTSNFSIGAGVTNLGAGLYKLNYTTKGPGLHREDWSLTNIDGSVAEFKNITPVSF